MKLVGKIIRNPLFWIFILALIFRVYKLGNYPVGFHVDEVKVGWNALSILETGRDDTGSFLSLYYNSFGDYRPTGIFYLTAPSLAIFGRSEFAVRLPSAIFGALTVFPIFYIAFEIFKKRKWSFFSSFFLAISPWHIEVSRATSEVVISTFFALFAIYFLIKLIETAERKFLLLCLSSVVVSYLLYHAIRFLAPPFFLITIAFYFTEIKNRLARKYVFIAIFSTFLLSVFFSLTPQARQRFNQVSIFKDVDITYEIERIQGENKVKNLFTTVFDNKTVVYTRRFIKEYGSYFGGSFLLGDTARPYRYTTPGAGLMGYIELMLFAVGLLEVIKGKRNLLPLMLLLIAPLPAAITTEDAPNLHRAFLMLPFIILIESYGFAKIVGAFRRYELGLQFFVLLLLILNFGLFTHMYFDHSYTHKPYIKNLILDDSSHRNIGTKELTLKLDELKKNYDLVIITRQPDNVYPWYAFFTGRDPVEFMKHLERPDDGSMKYQNIIFSTERCPSDDSFVNYKSQNILAVDYGGCGYQSDIDAGIPIKVLETITRPNGEVAYALLVRK